MNAVIGLVMSLLLVAAVAAMGGRAMPGTWYGELAKPAWTPPDWLFGPVWTLLYLLMAAAAWLVWRRGGWAGARGALALFVVQLAFNVGWSALFFGLKMPGAAVAEIIALWCLIAATVVAFWRARPAGGALLIPYLAWVSFAGVLNLRIWLLNR